MKLFILILLPFFSIAQASTYEPGDSTWITSSDTGKVKVYKEPPREKYDTIGPSWHQVSDTTSGYNPVMAMQLYEVRVYKNDWITIDPNILSMDATGQVVSSTLMGTYREQTLIPHHFAWLDLKKKPFKLTVWEDKFIAAVKRQEMTIDEANAAGMFNGCPIPNPAFKQKK